MKNKIIYAIAVSFSIVLFSNFSEAINWADRPDEKIILGTDGTLKTDRSDLNMKTGSTVTHRFGGVITSYSSSNPAIISVDAAIGGKSIRVTARSEGEAVVSVYWEFGDQYQTAKRLSLISITVKKKKDKKSPSLQDSIDEIESEMRTRQFDPDSLSFEDDNYEGLEVSGEALRLEEVTRADFLLFLEIFEDKHGLKLPQYLKDLMEFKINFNNDSFQIFPEFNHLIANHATNILHMNNLSPQLRIFVVETFLKSARKGFTNIVADEMMQFAHSKTKSNIEDRYGIMLSMPSYDIKDVAKLVAPPLLVDMVAIGYNINQKYQKMNKERQFYSHVYKTVYDSINLSSNQIKEKIVNQENENKYNEENIIKVSQNAYQQIYNIAKNLNLNPNDAVLRTMLWGKERESDVRPGQIQNEIEARNRFDRQIITFSEAKRIEWQKAVHIANNALREIGELGMKINQGNLIIHGLNLID